MEFKDVLRQLIEKSGKSVVELARVSRIGQASIYDAMRGDYVLAEEKVRRILDNIGATPGEEEQLIALQQKAQGWRSSKRMTNDAFQQRSQLIEFLRSNGIHVEEGPFFSACAVATLGNGKELPLFALLKLRYVEQTFGQAVRVMKTLKVYKAVIVMPYPTVAPEWYGTFEKYSIEVATPQEVLETLRDS
jgi:hypothetical protein